MDALQWESASKVSRIENGQGRLAPAEVDVLARLFQLDAQATERLRTMGAEARKTASYGRTPDWARTYVEWEAHANHIRTYEAELVPGLMQTPEYTRAVFESWFTDQATIDTMVDDRIRRQKTMERDSPPVLYAVLSEAVLRRVIGSPAIMSEQLSRLLDLAERPNVLVQVLPYSAGAHAAIGVNFVLLELRDLDMSTVYIEGLTSADYLDGSRHVDTYRLAFERIQASALGPPETVRLLQQLRDDFRQE